MFIAIVFLVFIAYIVVVAAYVVFARKWPAGCGGDCNQGREPCNCCAAVDQIVKDLDNSNNK